MKQLDPVGKTLPQLLVERARRDANEIAQRHKQHGIWKPITWGQVERHVEHLALGLADLGFERGQTLAIIGENEPQLFQAELAALALGGVVVCLYPDMTAQEMEYVLLDSDVHMVFAQDQEQVDKMLAIRERLPLLGSIVYWDSKGLWSYRQEGLIEFATVQERGRQYARSRPDFYSNAVELGRPVDIAVRMYSSGTTGKPKGVSCTHSFLIDNALRVCDGENPPTGAEYLSYISPAWGTEQVYGITLGLIRPLLVNFPERPESVQHDLREIGVECILFTPRQWENLASDIQARMLDSGTRRRLLYHWCTQLGAKRAQARLKGEEIAWHVRLLYPLAERVMLRPLRDKLGMVDVKYAVCGGAAMAPDVFGLFHAIGVPLRNIYGSTEFGYITMHRGKRFDLSTVGQMLDVHPHFGLPIEWRISTEGELLVRGGTGFGGYHKLPSKTPEMFVDEWYRTGDHCAVTSDGSLVFLERMADLRILASGHRYPPQYIETRLRYSPWIKEVMTVGDEHRPFVTALVTIDSETVTRWAEERGIGFSTFADLSQRPEVQELVRGEVEAVNRRLARESRVRRFACLPKEFDPDDGELTRTRKLKRGFLAERYSALITALYDDSVEKINLEIPVRYQDGRQGELKSVVRLVTTDVTKARSEESAEVAISEPR